MNVMEGPPGPHTRINGKLYNYFCGVSYHGLHGHPDCIEAARSALLAYGMNPATTRSGFGNTPLTLKLEKTAAEFLGEEDALYFISGYLGPNILLQALSVRFDRIFIDEHTHYCGFEAARLSGKPIATFRNRDAADLQEKLRGQPAVRPLILSDAVFPAFGDLAPVPDYAALAAEYDGVVVLDDAHGFGVLGPRGRGALEHFGLTADRIYTCTTMSKALGSLGGLIAGNRTFIGQLRAGAIIPNAASGPDVAATAAAIQALAILRTEPRRLIQLQANVAHFRDGLRDLGIDSGSSPAPIVAWHGGDEHTMRAIQKQLMDEGFVINLFKYPGTPESGVLRVSVFSSHTKDQLDALLQSLSKIKASLPMKT